MPYSPCNQQNHIYYIGDIKFTAIYSEEHVEVSVHASVGAAVRLLMFDTSSENF